MKRKNNNEQGEEQSEYVSLAESLRAEATEPDKRKQRKWTGNKIGR